MAFLRRLSRLLRLFETPYDAPRLPIWEHHRHHTEAHRLRVLWTGSQVAPVPILLREPADDG